MSTLEELTTPLTKEEIEASIYLAIESYGVSTAGWKPGAVTRTMIAVLAIVLASLSSLQAQLARLGFLHLSSGSWLEVVARQVYGVEKIHGTFATGVVLLTNAGGGVFSVDIGDLVVTNSAKGKSFRNLEAFTLGAGETASVAVRADERGSGSDSTVGTIDTIETTMLGVTVTNVAPIVGLDEEQDAQLVQRCEGKIAVLSPNGPADAWRSAALSAETAPDVSAGVTRVTTTADGTGGVSVVVANASGELAGTLGDPTTPLGAVEQAVHRQAEPLGITGTVSSAAPLGIAVEYIAHMRSGARTPNEVRDAIDIQLAKRLGTQPIGGSRVVAGPGFVFTEFIEAVISKEVGVDDLIVLTLTSPPADVEVAAGEAPVLSSVTGSVVAVTS